MIGFLKIYYVINHLLIKHNILLCAFFILYSTMAEGTAPPPKRNYVTWDDDMDAALLEVLVHHYNMGGHSQNGWKAHVYTAAIKNVKENDAEHPTVISIYTFIAPQAPSAPIGLKVNPLLFDIDMNIHWTWLLPHHGTLCIIRYEDDHNQAAREHPEGQGEGSQGHKEEGGVHKAKIASPRQPRGHGLP